MIRDGVAGTREGRGLAQILNDAGTSDPDIAFYRAARIYNSGSVEVEGCLECGGATHCYVSDVANRLTGWVFADSTCTL